MRKRDIFDFHNLTVLLTAWEEASLSREDRQVLEDLIFTVKSDADLRQKFVAEYPEMQDVLNLYINLEEAGSETMAGYLSDIDYEYFATDADNFIGRLKPNDALSKRRRWLRTLISISAAAVLISVIMTAVWRSASVSDIQNQPVDNVISFSASDSKENIINERPETKSVDTRTASVISPKTIKTKHNNCNAVNARKDSTKLLTEDDTDRAWLRFMSMRAEMAEVVRPEKKQVLYCDAPYIVTPDILSDDENFTIDISGSLEEAEDMLKSILCGL